MLLLKSAMNACELHPCGYGYPRDQVRFQVPAERPRSARAAPHTGEGAAQATVTVVSEPIVQTVRTRRPGAEQRDNGLCSDGLETGATALDRVLPSFVGVWAMSRGRS